MGCIEDCRKLVRDLDNKHVATSKDISELRGEVGVLSSDAFGFGIADVVGEKISVVEGKIITLEQSIANVESLQRQDTSKPMSASHVRDAGGSDQDSFSCDETLVLDPAMKELMLQTLHAALVPLAEHVTKKMIQMEAQIEAIT